MSSSSVAPETAKPASTINANLPAPKPTAPESPVAAITSDIAWIRGHVISIVLAVALIAGSIIGGIALFESLIERHDERVAAAQQQREGVDTAAQAALVAQLNQEHADNVARDVQQAALIQTLVSQMQQQRAATAKQVATDATLNAADAGSRLAEQTKAPAGSVTVANDTVTMNLPLTRVVIADLDQLVQAQSDVTNLTGQLNAQQILTSDAKVELSTANQIISADKTELIATIKGDNDACNVRIDKQAAKDRKRGFWATVGGIVGGIVIGRRF